MPTDSDLSQTDELLPPTTTEAPTVEATEASASEVSVADASALDAPLAEALAAETAAEPTLADKLDSAAAPAWHVPGPVRAAQDAAPADDFGSMSSKQISTWLDTAVSGESTLRFVP